MGDSSKTKSPIKIFNHKKFYEGTIYTTFYGYKIKVVEYIDHRNVIVEFLDSGIRRKTNIDAVKNGYVKNPNMMNEKYLGKIYMTNEGDKIKIIGYRWSQDVDVEFIDYGFCVYNIKIGSIVNGAVKNPLHPNKYGAYLGLGPYNYSNCRPAYEAWRAMFNRVNNRENYKNTHICNEWYNFQLYAEWYISKYSKLDKSISYVVDKDIKQLGQSEKYYSPDTCILVPQIINSNINDIEGIYTDTNKGWTYIKNRKEKYSARMVDHDKTSINVLGNYSTPEEANFVYKTAKLNYFKNICSDCLNKNILLKDDYEFIISIINSLALKYNIEVN